MTRSYGGRARDVVGEHVGLSGSTYERAKRVVEAAEDETLPFEVRETAKEAREQMDETGKVKPAYDKVRAARRGLVAKGHGSLLLQKARHREPARFRGWPPSCAWWPG